MYQKVEEEKKLKFTFEPPPFEQNYSDYTYSHTHTA